MIALLLTILALNLLISTLFFESCKSVYIFISDLLRDDIFSFLDFFSSVSVDIWVHQTKEAIWPKTIECYYIFQVGALNGGTSLVNAYTQ